MQQFLQDELLETLPSDYDRAELLRAERATYVIHQNVSYEYTRPIRDLRQRLVVLPRLSHVDQSRIAHRVAVHTSTPGAHHTRLQTDHFGNSVVVATVPSVKHRIEFQTRAVLSRRPRDPQRVTWRSGGPTITNLTAPDDAIRDAALRFDRRGDVFETADEIATFIRDSFEYCHDVTTVRTTAAEAWQLRRGLCQDMAHVMIAMCSSVGIRARYISGHLVGDGASHAWAEVFDPERNAVAAIDPTHRRRTDLRYITVAAGRDYRDVAPTSGTYTSNGGRGRLHVRKTIRLAELA